MAGCFLSRTVTSIENAQSAEPQSTRRDHVVRSRGDCFNKDQDVINTCMNKYLSSVRIRGQIVKMAVFADSMIHARLILEYQFGMNSLATAPVQVNEAGTIKPQTPDQARLAALKRQKDNMAKQIEAERDRQKIHRAQQQISQAINSKSSSVA